MLGRVGLRSAAAGSLLVSRFLSRYIGQPTGFTHPELLEKDESEGREREGGRGKEREIEEGEYALVFLHLSIHSCPQFYQG